MSSLRLALKQSLQETGHLFKDKKKKSSSSKSKESNKHSNKPSSKSSSSKQRRPRQPGDPPRKRGRPRKHPLPEEHQQQQQSSPTKASSSSQHAVNDGREGGDSTNRRGDSNHHHSGSEEEDSESENEFSYCSEEEEDDSEGDEDEEEDEEGEEHDDEQDHANQSHHDDEDEEEEESGHPEEDGVPPVMAAAASTANATSPASPKAEPKEDTTTESDEERRRKKKEFKKHLQQAAHKIQAQWKKKAGISSSQGSDDDDEHERKDRSYDDVGTTTPKQYPQRSTSPMRHRDHSSHSNASTPTSGDKQQTSKKKKDSGSSKLQTVPPPEPEVLEWNRSLSEKKSRKHVSAGLRVKVRFAAKVKRDGKVVKKKIWYGGRVSAVSKEGSKIRIKYDDGTSEISKFPDKDVVVDDTFNGKHLVAAVKFIPPVMAAAEEDDVEEDAEEGEIQTQAVVVKRGAGADDTTKKNVPEVVAETSKNLPSDDTQAKPAAPEKSKPLVNAEPNAPAPAKEELEDKTADVATTTSNEDHAPAAPKEDIAPVAEPKVDASPEVEEPKPSTEPVVAPMETVADDSAMAVPEMPAEPEKEPSVPAEATTPAEVLEAGEVVTTPKPKSTASMIASAITASEEGRLPRDLGSPEEGEISPGISLLSRARDTTDMPEPMETDEEPPKQNGGDEAVGEMDNTKATADGDAEPKVKDSVDLPPAVAEEAVDSKPPEAPIEDVADAPNAAPNDTMFQDLKPPAADAAETEATSAQEKPTEQAREQSSPSTHKPLKIHIVNTKPDAEVGNVVAVQSPKDMESDSEEELFADTPVTERKVKSIQLKRKSKRKREVTEGPVDEQPSKKKIHIKRTKASMDTNDLGAVSDAEEDTMNPGSTSDVEEETTEKPADIQGALEARSALSEPVRTDGEEVKKPNTTISVSLRKPEADEAEHLLVPKLKKKKDRANIAVKGRKSPVPRSSSPTPQLESAPTMDSQVSEERASGSPGVDDAAALSPKRGKAIASVRGRPGGEADEAAPEAPMLDELSAEVRPLSRSKGSADSLPGMRSGRRAAQQAKEKMTPKQQEDKALELGKKKKKRKRNEGEEDGEQSADESVDDRQWVQCDDCGKWRILPSSVKISSLPKNWYCRLNTYDPKRNACSAPEQSAKQAAKEWRKARKRLKQQRLAEQQAEEAAQKILEEAPIEVKKEPLVSTSPKPPKGTKKERIDAKRASPVVAEESQASNSGSDVPKERKGKKGKQLPPLPPPQEEVEPAPPTPPPPESDAPKKPGRKRGRPARNQTPQKENEDHDNVEWVQCEKCEKWRKLPPHISADELPDTWYCSMNTWNPDAASCTAAEDKADATHHEVGNYAGLFGGGAGKYSYRSMIFGTGKKHNRPMSERSRAAESLFMRPIDEVENPYPTVMYSKSSCFLPRTSNFTKANAIEEDKPPSIFDVLSNSELWAELHTVGHPMQVTSSSSDSGQAYPKFLSFENLPEDIKEAMREVVLRSLGEGTLTGEELIREVQHYPWESVSPDLAAIRGYFNVDIIINSLLALVRDGVVEMTSMRNFKVPIGQWVPKYRKVRSLRAMKIEESIKSSRCMKISKPWKNSDWISGGSAFS